MHVSPGNTLEEESSMVTQRENRINELLEWAKENNIRKSIPEVWKNGMAGTIMRVGEWGRVAGSNHSRGSNEVQGDLSNSGRLR